MANPTAVSARIVPATATPAVVLGDHEGSSAETGVAVGFPVGTLVGVGGGVGVLVAVAARVASEVGVLLCSGVAVRVGATTGV